MMVVELEDGQREVYLFWMGLYSPKRLLNLGSPPGSNFVFQNYVLTELKSGVFFF